MYKREERLWPGGCGLFPSHSCVKREDSKSNRQTIQINPKSK